MEAMKILRKAQRLGLLVYWGNGDICVDGDEEAIKSILPALQANSRKVSALLKAKGPRQSLAPVDRNL